MPFSSSEIQPSIHALKLEGVVTLDEVAQLFKALEQRLKTGVSPLAFVIDLTTSTAPGGTNKLRQHVTEAFSNHTKPWGHCAGVGVVAETECQDSFLRSVLASGPIPMPYRFFKNEGEAVTWARSRLRAAK